LDKKIKPTFEEVFTKAGLIPEWIESGRIQGMETAVRNALAKGLPVNLIHNITGLDPEIIKKIKKKDQMERFQLSAYLNVIINANPETFLEGRKDNVEEFDELLMEANIIPKWIEQGRIQGIETAARNAIIKGLPIDVIHDITGLDEETIKQLAVNI